jgi:hypothetical protein
MPLLNICTITGNNIVIQAGLAFLSGEKEVDYNWAIDYILDIMAKHSIKVPRSIVTDRAGFNAVPGYSISYISAYTLPLAC